MSVQAFAFTGGRKRKSAATASLDIALVGPRGRVARALRDHLVQHGDAIADRDGVRLSIVAAVDRQRWRWRPDGLAPARLEDELAGGETPDWKGLIDRLASRPRRTVVVDCTASPEVSARYAALLEAGVGVVTPNKLANAGPLPEYRRLIELSRGGEPAYRYETTVGAALPVLGTLRDLVRTGDRVRRIEAVLSGTISYVLQRVADGTPFSRAVCDAHRLGYSEPHPGDDLCGEDVARKLVILLREIGLPVERAAVAVEPLVPPALLAERDVPRFLRTLPEGDAVWAGRAAAARANGARLAYVARWDGARASIAIDEAPDGSRLARLGPGENVVSIWSDRYPEVPLTIAGPGAGREVTAAGLLVELIDVGRD